MTHIEGKRGCCTIHFRTAVSFHTPFTMMSLGVGFIYKRFLHEMQDILIPESKLLHPA